MDFKRSAAAVLYAVFAFSAFADVRPASIIGDNMVFQAGMPMRVWGSADAGERVKATFMGKSAQTVAGKDGAWYLELPKSSYVREGQTLLIEGKNRVEIRNVLVGEVWLLSGQSNMDFPLAYLKGGRELINADENPLMRFFDIKGGASGRPVDATELNASWSVADKKSRERMSGLGVLFGNRIFSELKVPVGLVHASYGGSEIQAWLPWEYADTTGEREWIEAADRRIRGWKAKDIAKWEALDEGERAKKKKPDALEGTVACFYNSKISPIIPYSVRGEIWYQGEGNAGAPRPYLNIFRVYAAMMREKFENPGMPIYVVQLPDYNNKDWPAFREAQRQIALSVPKCALAVTIDGGEIDLHPRDKDRVGKRLAEMALSDVYGQKRGAHSPIAPVAKLLGNVVKVKFDNAYKGLKTNDGGAPRTFELSDDGKNFIAAEAKISGRDEVDVMLPGGVSKPVKIRYGWAADPDVNLCNSSDLPASPFEIGVD